MRTCLWQPTFYKLLEMLHLSCDPVVNQQARELFDAISNKHDLARLLTDPFSSVPDDSREACVRLFRFVDQHSTDEMIAVLNPIGPAEFVPKVRAKFRQVQTRIRHVDEARSKSPTEEYWSHFGL